MGEPSTKTETNEEPQTRVVALRNLRTLRGRRGTGSMSTVGWRYSVRVLRVVTSGQRLVQIASNSLYRSLLLWRVPGRPISTRYHMYFTLWCSTYLHATTKSSVTTTVLATGDHLYPYSALEDALAQQCSRRPHSSLMLPPHSRFISVTPSSRVQPTTGDTSQI
jgi:hypothetical protein